MERLWLDLKLFTIILKSLKKIFFLYSFLPFFIHFFKWILTGSSSVIVDSIELRPLPLTLKKTDLIYTTVHANITKQFPNDAIMSVEVNKTISFLGKKYNVRLPCLKDLGSCRIPMNKIFDTWYGEWLCPMFRLSHKFCYLPILPGEYSLKNFDVPVPFKKFKKIIATIASVSYSIWLAN